MNALRISYTIFCMKGSPTNTVIVTKSRGKLNTNTCVRYCTGRINSVQWSIEHLPQLYKVEMHSSSFYVYAKAETQNQTSINKKSTEKTNTAE